MYEFLRGKLMHASPTRVTLEVGGLGFRLEIGLSTFSKLPALGETALFYVSLIVKEDAHLLHGFLSLEERNFFEKLLAISGVGPKTATALLGHVEYEALQLAIAQGNILLLSKAPGIGKKTAERIVLDLRDKVDKGIVLTAKEPSAIKDAVAALIHLGMTPVRAHEAVKRVSGSGEREVSRLIALALKEPFSP